MYNGNLENRIYTLSNAAEHVSSMESHQADVREGIALTATALIIADVLVRIEEHGDRDGYLSAYRKNSGADWKEQKASLELAKVSNSTIKRVRTPLRSAKFWKFLDSVEIIREDNGDITALNILEMFKAQELTASKLLAFGPKAKANGPVEKVDEATESINKLEAGDDKLIAKLEAKASDLLAAIEQLKKRSTVKQAA